MKNFKKGAAFGVAFAVAGLGLAAPAFAAEDTTPTKPTCDSLPIAERILCLKGDPKVQGLIDPFETQNNYIEKQTNEMNALIEDLANDDIHNNLSTEKRKQLEDTIQNKSDAIEEVKKAVAENKVAIKEARRKAERNAKFEAYKKDPNVLEATENLSLGIKGEETLKSRLDRYKKDPNVLDATENLNLGIKGNETLKSRLDRYKKDPNVLEATDGLAKALHDGFPIIEKSMETVPAMELTPAKKVAEPKKAEEAKAGELAKTGVGVGVLAGIATLSTIGGAAALRRRNH
ncbi:hypothetical protein JTE88_02675 [Arcanobacterium phocisimile]|uniref:LPXTG-motif cell wall anchor domain-containing protein n=1 Tax=Arcanobacterium phocisimile TaxID=1302235 RepID=A0ABX7IHV3_9ACTO|nr:hypothetical protein [Arcanobacterium phocisimile]QRV02662.1 hypothetical protein JTE88_02675 [Arcanobacterium phocisimile]